MSASGAGRFLPIGVMGIDNRKLGMLIFLSSEVMLFAGFIGSFVNLRAANLVIGRTRREAGQPGQALAVLRRRPDIVGEAVVTGVRTNAFGFTVDYLREEAPLFAALGDTATAMATYEHYLRLRDERPDYEPWAAQWDSVRTEYEALTALR